MIYIILVPDALVDIQKGQQFVLSVGDNRSLVNRKAIFTVVNAHESKKILSKLTEGAYVRRSWLSVGDTFVFRDKSCWLTYYSANEENKLFSFILDCKT